MNHPIHIQLIASWLTIEQRVTHTKRRGSNDFTGLIALSLTNWSTYTALRKFPIMIRFPILRIKLISIEYWRTISVTLDVYSKCALSRFHPNLSSIIHVTMNDISLFDSIFSSLVPIAHLTMNSGCYNSIPSDKMPYLRELNLIHGGPIELCILARYPLLEKLCLEAVVVYWSFQNDPRDHDSVNDWPRLKYIRLRDVRLAEHCELLDLFQPCVPGKRILTTLESEYWMQRS